MTEKEFVELIGPLAAADYKESGILASITAAQACLESGYGSTERKTGRKTGSIERVFGEVLIQYS